MRKAAFISILLTLVGSLSLRAQDVADEYEAHFGWSEDGLVESEQEEEQGPRSLQEAVKQGRGYRIGSGGVHKQVGAAIDSDKDVHSVIEGDTLWDLSAHYFGDAWHWPELWSFNPEITNPHWIYPLDQVRLTPQTLAQDQMVAKVQAGGGLEEVKGQSPGVLLGTETARAVVVPRALWKPGVVFLRDQGYLDDEALGTVGQVIGGNEEHMLLSPSDEPYLTFRQDHDVKPGDVYSIFRTIKAEEREEDAQGTLVRIVGAAVVRSYDRNKRVASALIIEAMDPIERGMYVAKLDRRFDLVPPLENSANVVAHIVATVRPHRLLGYGDVVFLDVGQGSGVLPGNRFFIVRRGDGWLETLDAEPEEVGAIEEIPEYEPEKLPKEVVAELRVIKVRKNTTIALIIRSDTDLKVGDTAEMRVGF